MDFPRLCHVRSTQILSLRHNRLTGTVPPELGRLSQLKTLYMEKNELEGNIPDTLANLASLEELNLLGNNFQGDTFCLSQHQAECERFVQYVY